MFFFANFCLLFLPSQEIAAIILPSDSLVTTTSFYFTPSEVDRMEISYKKLWKLLIDKDMNKGDLQKAAGISWASVTKMSKGESVSMDILMKTCRALNCNIGDIMDLINDENDLVSQDDNSKSNLSGQVGESK